MINILTIIFIPNNIYISYHEETGTNQDIITLSRHLLNRNVAKRTISKQEAMCQLGNLDTIYVLKQ